MGQRQSADANVNVQTWIENRNKMNRFVIGWQNFSFNLFYKWEQHTGQQMNWYYAKYVPTDLLTIDVREYMKNNQPHDLKMKVMTGLWLVDDHIDIYSQHTLLHDAVIFNRDEIFDFLLV